MNKMRNNKKFRVKDFNNCFYKGFNTLKKAVSFGLIGALCISSVVSAQGFGVSTHMGLNDVYDNDMCLHSIKKVNADWIRDESRWKYMQNGENGTFSMRYKDIDYIKSAHQKGINQLLILAFGNTTYTGITSEATIPTQSNTKYYRGYLDYVRETVNAVKDYVGAYEIWNEPNYVNFNATSVSGTDYAKLYLDAREIIKELDPTATVICGSVTGTNGEGEAFTKEIFDYVKTKGSINTLIDAFSIHIYEQKDNGLYAAQLDKYEKVFDDYGYTGDVWMTENGVTVYGSISGTEQAQMVAKMGIIWENYLKTNNRDGVNFWYTLVNKNGDSQYENNFGLFDLNYDFKESGLALKAYNTLTKDKKFENVSNVGNGYLAKYTGDKGNVYVMYDNNQKAKAEVALSGDVAYMYNYLGVVTETINNPTGTKNVALTKAPVYIECRNVLSKIDSLSYDEEDAILAVSGEYNGGDTVTIEVIKDGIILDKQTAVVTDGKFDKWFSFIGDGEYTVRVGKDEMADIGKTSGWAEKKITVKDPYAKPVFDTGTKILYDAVSRKVSVSGKIKNAKQNGSVTVLAVPQSMNLENIDLNGTAYIGQTKIQNGEFKTEFYLPNGFSSDISIYLGGTEIKNLFTDDIKVGKGEFVYVSELKLDKGSILKATAFVQNFTDSDKSAMLIIAQYDDKKIVDIKYENKVVKAKTYTTIECTLDNVEICDKAIKASAFIWNSTDGIVPLFGKTDINL